MHPSLLLGLAAVATAKVTFNTEVPEFGFNGKLATDAVSEECLKAYSVELNCSENLYAFRNDTLGPDLISKKSLTEFCTDECIDDLNAWDNAVRKACSKDDLEKLEKRSDAEVPEYYKMVLRGMHEVQEHLYWPFCIQDQQTKDFCLLKSLPDFPPADAVSLEVTGEFCYNSCRQQQSYLVHSAAAASSLEAKIFNSAGCPKIDQSSFDMNSRSFEAFGVSVLDTKPKGKVVPAEGKLLEGTGYQIQELFQTVLVGSGSGSNDTKTNGTIPGSKPDAPLEESAAGVKAASLGAMGLAALAAVLMF